MHAQISLIDSYIRAFDAIITDYNPQHAAVCFDRTAFYPGGGGQPCDHGVLTLDGQPRSVTRVAKETGRIWHFLPGPEDLEVGARVHGELDWERRYALMRAHTALHVLCGVVWRDWGAQVTGGNMEPGKGRMDFEFKRLSKDLVGEIETRCNQEVEAAREVSVRVLPREEALAIPDLIRTKINLLPKGIREVRTVELVGLDLQADGGTHVANTREIGYMRIVDYKSKGASNKRIYVRVD